MTYPMPDRKPAADWLKALANPTRLLLVEALLGGPAPCGGLAVRLGVAQSDVSAHLKVLLDGGLVARERAGRRMVYSLACPVTRDGRRVTLHGPGVRAHVETGEG